MKTSLKVALALAGAGAIIAWVLIDGEQREARLTAKGTAVVTAVKLDQDVESRSLDETEFALRLQAGEREITTSASLPGDRTGEFREGHTFTVCYDPDNPAEADIELNPAANCG